MSGIGGGAIQLPSHGSATFKVKPTRSGGQTLNVDALILRKITSNIPSCPVPFDNRWKHLSGLSLADPDFGKPGTIDILLGGDIFFRTMLHGRRIGPSGSPSAIKTSFGWVLTGSVRTTGVGNSQGNCYLATATSDNLLKKFWEVEDYHLQQPLLSSEEQAVVDHFQRSYSNTETGQFVVPLPIKDNVIPLGESRSLAVRRLKTLERSLRSRSQFKEFADAVDEYLEMGHAELVPVSDLAKPCSEVYYFPMHAVRKESSSTTKVRVVFDASAKTASGTSLNDHLLIGPTVHPTLVDVLLRFRRHRIAMTADVSRMYRAVLLPKHQRDLHRFVWRKDPREPLKDYRMTRLTFGVSASPFAANMAMRQNALNYQNEFPLAAQAVIDSFYVDDGLTGEDTLEKAIELRSEMQELFEAGGFVLRKWKSNEPAVLAQIPPQLVDSQSTQAIVADQFVKVLGVEWNAISDTFRPVVSSLKSMESLTKRALLSDIARLFDVLGWCSPAVVKPKILLQHVWKEKCGWDDPVPQPILAVWQRWRSELPVLQERYIQRSYFPNDFDVASMELHGFCDASEAAYAGVVYLRATDSHSSSIHTTLVMAKTKVAPIKRLSVPRLELCGALLITNLLIHCGKTLGIPLESTYVWTDSTVVLCWLRGVHH